jgi:hypothetical protein
VVYVCERVDGVGMAGGASMGYLLTAVVILVGAFVGAVLLLNAIELLKLVWWKRRRCPRCRRRLAFSGWDWGEWHNQNVRNKEKVRGKLRERGVTWACVICPHCKYPIPARKLHAFS